MVKVIGMKGEGSECVNIHAGRTRGFAVLMIRKLEDVSSGAGDHFTKDDDNRYQFREGGGSDVKVEVENLTRTVVEKVHGRMRVVPCEAKHAVKTGLTGPSLGTAVVDAPTNLTLLGESSVWDRREFK